MTLIDSSELESELRKVISGVSRDKNLDRAVIIDALQQAGYVLHTCESCVKVLHPDICQC